jgi:hypothetical protein
LLPIVFFFISKKLIVRFFLHWRFQIEKNYFFTVMNVEEVPLTPSFEIPSATMTFFPGRSEV